jgi:hypothetical protein
VDSSRSRRFTSERSLPVLFQNTTRGGQVLPDTDCAAILPHDRHMHAHVRLAVAPCELQLVCERIRRGGRISLLADYCHYRTD